MARGCATVVGFGAAAFAGAIDAALGDPAGSAELAARGRALAERELNWTAIGDQLDGVLRKLVPGGEAHARCA